MSIHPAMIITIVVNPKVSYPLLDPFREYGWFSMHSPFTKLVNNSLFRCIFDPILVPLTASASLPGCGAEIAKASATSACNMEASLT